jgi:PAS domain S-box-containing protein
MLDKEGNVIGIVGITRDITEQKKAEEKRIEAEKAVKSKTMAAEAAAKVAAATGGMAQKYKAIIKELKRAEEERVLALKRAAETIEAMPIGVTVIDLGGKIIQDNEVANKMFGTERGGDVEKLVTDFIVKEDAPGALEAIQECLKNGYYRGFETTGVKKDGSKFPLLVDGTVIKDLKGNPSSIVITYRDITELKRVKELEEKLKTYEK